MYHRRAFNAQPSMAMGMVMRGGETRVMTSSKMHEFESGGFRSSKPKIEMTWLGYETGVTRGEKGLVSLRLVYALELDLHQVMEETDEARLGWSD